MRFTWGVKVCIPEAIRKVTLKISYLGVGSGFEEAVPCQVAEYPSSSMQASGQSFMSKADTKITRAVLLCVSLVCLWAHVLHLIKSCLFSLLRTIQTPWAGRIAPPGPAPSDGSQVPLRVKLPPSWGATPLRPVMLPLLVSQKSALSSV